MDFGQLVHLILHFSSKGMEDAIGQYGAFIYLFLCAIVFSETGFVVLFFLPGDTLLFIGGATCVGGGMNMGLLMFLLVLAAVGGSTLNYTIGRFIGQKVFTHNYRWLDQDALKKTHVFYEKYGGLTMVLSRFVPVVRTFAPFVAGVSEMPFARFQVFNIAGAAFWVLLLVTCGYFFGSIPLLHDHLDAVVLVGVAAAILPVVIGGLLKFRKKLMKK